MSKAATTPHPLATIASDALDHIDCAQTYAKWLDALASSIGDALSEEPTLTRAGAARAKTLVGLAQYLACDLTSNLDCQAEDLRQKLDSLGGAV